MEMYPHVGDKDALDIIREKSLNITHCPWLRRDPNACDAMPADVDGVEEGAVCPHNVYISKPEIFTNRDGVIDTIERLFRLINSAEIGLLSDSDIDPLSVSELLASRGELDRQRSDKTKADQEQARYQQMRAEALVNQPRER